MFLALQCFVILLIFLFWAGTKHKEFDKIPGPPGYFLLNNTLDFLMDPVQLFYHMRMLSNKYKGLLRIKFGPLKAVFINQPEYIEKVINGSTHTVKGIVYNFVEPWLKDGLLLSNGSKWQQRRKLLSPAFHFNVLNYYKSVIDESCQNFLDKLGKEVDAPNTDIMPYVEDFVINSICKTAMGTQLHEEDSNFGKMYKEGIYKLGEYAVYRTQRIWMHPYIIFKFTSVGRKLLNICKILSSFRNRVIEKRRNLKNNSKTNFNEELNINENVHLNGKKKMALLDLLLKAEKDGVIDKEGIGEEVDTFLFGGHDTTANTLQFTMMALANNQEAQEKVVKECNEIFGSSKRSADMSDLAQMKYLECCIKESMRLYPPIPSLNRTVKQEVNLGKYQIPVGTECGIMIFDLHRRNDQFVEPQEFRPERFQAEPTWHPYAYIPFSAGPRNCIVHKMVLRLRRLSIPDFPWAWNNSLCPVVQMPFSKKEATDFKCPQDQFKMFYGTNKEKDTLWRFILFIGQKFAMMELKVALSALLRRYRLLPVTKPNDIIFVMDFVLRIKEPIYVKLELRSEA